jgi:hypothetical protein
VGRRKRLGSVERGKQRETKENKKHTARLINRRTTIKGESGKENSYEEERG